MNLIEEINKRLGNMLGASQEKKEEVVVKFLHTLNFSDPEHRSQAESFSKSFLKHLEHNTRVSRIMAKTVHCMLARISLYDLGVQDVEVKYRDKTPEDAGDAYYTHSKTKPYITYFNQNVANEDELLSPSYLNHQDKTFGGKSRLEYFAKQIYAMEHENQHILQYRSVDAAESGKIEITPETYLLSKQILVRNISNSLQGKHFEKGKNPNRLYNENHEVFLMEIDANKAGYERSLDRIRKLNKTAYEQATSEKGGRFLIKLKNEKEKLEDQSSVRWEHTTNPSSEPVVAHHKASMVLAYTLAIMPQKQRAEAFKMFPSLAITFSSSGKRKSLQQIEKEKNKKIDEIFKDYPESEIQNKLSNLSKLYETAIESDPVLSLERSLEHISKINYEAESYHTEGGDEIKYSPQRLGTEIKAVTKKAKDCAIAIEAFGYDDVNAIFAKYKRQVMKPKVKDWQSASLFQEKKLALYSVESTLYSKNTTIKNIKTKKNQKKSKENQERQEYIRKIQTVFPGFTPSPVLSVGLRAKRPIVTDNNIEKLLLIESYKKYSKFFRENKLKADGEKIISPIDLSNAIRRIYTGIESPYDEEELSNKLESGEMNILESAPEKALREKQEQEKNQGKQKDKEPEKIDSKRKDSTQEKLTR